MSGAGGGARLKSDFDFLQEGRRKVLVLLDQVDFADKTFPALEPLEFYDRIYNMFSMMSIQQCVKNTLLHHA